MYCNNCGNKLSDKSVFCSECGARVNTKPSETSAYNRSQIPTEVTGNGPSIPNTVTQTQEKTKKVSGKEIIVTFSIMAVMALVLVGHKDDKLSSINGPIFLTSIPGIICAVFYHRRLPNKKADKLGSVISVLSGINLVCCFLLSLALAGDEPFLSALASGLGYCIIYIGFSIFNIHKVKSNRKLLR